MLMLTGPYNVFIVAADNSPRFRRWSVPQRRLTNYVLTCSSKGEEELTIAGEKLRVPDGGCYMLPPQLLTDIESHQGNQPLWVHFEVIWNELRGRHPWPISRDPNWESTRRFAQPSPLEIWGIDLPILLPERLWVRIAESLPEIVTGWRTGKAPRMLRAQYELEGLLLNWVTFEWERASQPNTLSARERIERAEALVRNDLAAGLGASDMATAAGYSRSRFAEVYFQLRKQSPGQFLLQSRISRAKSLLRQTDLPAREVAQLVGYSDSTAFGRAFREVCGLTPLAWRKQKAPGGAE